MEKNIDDKFVDFLTSSEEYGYKRKDLRRRCIWTRGNPYRAVAVYDKDSIIQLFVFMSENARSQHRHYPFYKSFEQNPSKLENIYPPSYIVTYYPGKDNFKYFNASNALFEVDPDKILNYRMARANFKRRRNSQPTVKLLKRIKWISWTLALILFICLMTYVVYSINHEGNNPNDVIVGLSITIVVLILFPVLLPISNKISFSGLSMGFNDINE